jgi:hypothetical protein
MHRLAPATLLLATSALIEPSPCVVILLGAPPPPPPPLCLMRARLTTVSFCANKILWHHVSNLRRLPHLSECYNNDEAIARDARQQFALALRTNAIDFPVFSEHRRRVVSLQHSLDSFNATVKRDAREVVEATQLKTIVARVRVDHALAHRPPIVASTMRFFVRAVALFKNVVGTSMAVRFAVCDTGDRAAHVPAARAR